MDYCLSYFSAFNLLMSSSRPFDSLSTANAMVRAPLVPESTPGAAMERELAVYYGHLPEIQGVRLHQESKSKVDLLIRDLNSASIRENVALHICNAKVLPSSLLPIGADLKGFITSPEFTYLQIASKLDFIGTILAGSALFFEPGWTWWSFTTPKWPTDKSCCNCKVSFHARKKARHRPSKTSASAHSRESSVTTRSLACAAIVPSVQPWWL